MIRRAAVGAFVGVALAACGGGGGRLTTPTAASGPPLSQPALVATTEAPSPPRGSPAAAIDALCRAGVDPDAQAAATLFADDAHDALHDLALAVESKDRASAARLYQATEVVESDFSTAGTPTGNRSANLRALATAASQSAAVLDVATSPCPK